MASRPSVARCRAESLIRSARNNAHSARSDSFSVCSFAASRGYSLTERHSSRYDRQRWLKGRLLAELRVCQARRAAPGVAGSVRYRVAVHTPPMAAKRSAGVPPAGRGASSPREGERALREGRSSRDAGFRLECPTRGGTPHGQPAGTPALLGSNTRNVGCRAYPPATRSECVQKSAAYPTCHPEWEVGRARRISCGKRDPRKLDETGVLVLARSSFFARDPSRPTHPPLPMT